MIPVRLIDDNLSIVPLLVLSTGADFIVNTDGKISVFVGNTNIREEMRFFGAQHDGGEFSVDGLAIGTYLSIVSSQPILSASIRWKGEGSMFITPMEVSMHSRPVHADETKVLRYIQEAELNNVKPAMGDDAYMDAKTSDRYPLLLDGGTYDHQGRRYRFAGLKTALAYYTYSRLIESSSVDVTRQGVINRRSEYSDSADSSVIVSVSRETYAIADRYMEECLQYIRSIDGGDCGNNDVNSNRTKFKIIGD